MLAERRASRRGGGRGRRLCMAGQPFLDGGVDRLAKLLAGERLGQAMACARQRQMAQGFRVAAAREKDQRRAGRQLRHALERLDPETGRVVDQDGVRPDRDQAALGLRDVRLAQEQVRFGQGRPQRFANGAIFRQCK